ncbi:hypothetical protein SAMN05216175_1283 [Neptunomonas qingdaonensis]|uniref:Uncharacterized protein n=1 Tax=Neptunomonas qingdaonensis TaxID=1045558 RepID=A0A1I2WG88_9GAMM|nr:hypothetical protein SAMN05216175_1283 [Neptunomonas qingdaonensis]
MTNISKNERVLQRLYYVDENPYFLESMFEFVSRDKS